MILIMPTNVASNNYANLNELNNLHPHHPVHTTPPPKKKSENLQSSDGFARSRSYQFS